MAKQGLRIEKDSMGELEVPANALWGAQTQRAYNNFPVSGLRITRAALLDVLEDDPGTALEVLAAFASVASALRDAAARGRGAGE